MRESNTKFSLSKLVNLLTSALFFHSLRCTRSSSLISQITGVGLVAAGIMTPPHVSPQRHLAATISTILNLIHFTQCQLDDGDIDGRHRSRSTPTNGHRFTVLSLP